jgi:hypothetical protein
MNIENILLILSAGFMFGFISGCISGYKKAKENIKHISDNCNNKAEAFYDRVYNEFLN